MRKPKKFDVNKLRWRRVVVTFIDNRRPLPSSRFHKRTFTLCTRSEALAVSRAFCAIFSWSIIGVDCFDSL